tara:strand:+ start:1110 stop:1592 length:483 start_codon:yes stop_codon:yes gene_type:complete
MILEYYIIRDDVHPPTRANPSDAGLDICYSPDTSKYTQLHGGSIFIEPGESEILPTGLKFGVPHGYMLEVKNRSGMAAKNNLLVGACVIDSGYDGEVFINLHNVGKDMRMIKPGDRIAQVVLVPVVHFRAVATAEDNLYDWYPITISDRGAGALGSTDKK